MTTALCINCGELKFGALCPCPKCEASSTGNMELDIAFSDHNIAEESLRDLGEVVAHFQAKTDDPGVAFWAFIRFISEQHDSILSAQVPSEFIDQVSAIYVDAELPKLNLKPSPMAQLGGDSTSE